jgi:hypothetical protein
MPLSGWPSPPKTWTASIPRDMEERRLKNLRALSRKVEMFKSFTMGFKRGSDAAMVAMLVEIMPQYKLSVIVTSDHIQIKCPVFHQVSRNDSLTDFIFILADPVEP